MKTAKNFNIPRDSVHHQWYRKRSPCRNATASTGSGSKGVQGPHENGGGDSRPVKLNVCGKPTPADDTPTEPTLCGGEDHHIQRQEKSGSGCVWIFFPDWEKGPWGKCGKSTGLDNPLGRSPETGVKEVQHAYPVVFGGPVDHILTRRKSQR